MAKKSKVAGESNAAPEEQLLKDPSPESAGSGAPQKRGRGRPKGSGKKAIIKKKGKRGRPKGSKNRANEAGKRPRGRPPGSGKSGLKSGTNLRAIITQIVRKEVHSALMAAFRGL